jgi:hypothetical protein
MGTENRGSLGTVRLAIRNRRFGRLRIRGDMLEIGRENIGIRHGG